jgi:hypothetical protein
MVDLFECSVEGTNLETVVCDIQDEILAHHGQADEAEVCAVETARRSAL